MRAQALNAVILDAASLGDVDLSELEPLCKHCQIHQSTQPNDIIAHIADAEIVLTNKVVISAQTMAACPNIKYIGVLATGTNNIDLIAASQQGIVVSNAAAYGTSSVVQHTIALILALSTNLNPYVDDVKHDRWQASPVFTLLNHPITELAGKTLGIIGYGELGSNVAKIAKAFGMEIKIAARDSQDSRQGRIPLDQLLKIADYVTLHCPLTETNQYLIDRHTLALMKPSAYLINTARGGLVNPAHLIDALQTGVIKGAAVDVLEQEPPSPEDPLIRAAATLNLLITPHNAWAAIESRQRLIGQSAANIRAFIQGQPLRRVN